MGSPHLPRCRVGGLSLCRRSSFLPLTCACDLCLTSTLRNGCVCAVGTSGCFSPDPGRVSLAGRWLHRRHVQVRCSPSVPACSCFEAEGTCHYVLYVLCKEQLAEGLQCFAGRPRHPGLEPCGRTVSA